jgi:arylsulfatase A-like enzyme
MMSQPLIDHPAPPQRAERPGPASLVLWAAWFGLLGGTLELAAFLLKCHVLDPRNYNVSRHYPWMFPLAGVLLAVLPALVLAAAARLRPGRIPARLALAAVSFLPFLGLLFRGPIYTLACLALAAGFAYQTARYLAARVDRFDRLVRTSLPGLLGLLALTAALCSARGAWPAHREPAARSTSGPGARNVLLIVLDTVRAQSLGLYGYHRPTTPNLRRIAARGVRFDQAYSTAPWTAPSHASMFTGRWHHELSIGWKRPLDGSRPTLAEFLSSHGYDTAGFVANTSYCSYETGLSRGFAHYEDYDVTPRAVLLCSALVQRTANFFHTHPRLSSRLGSISLMSSDRKSAARINADFLRWLSRRGDRPFFAFLNYFDAHHPYFSPESDADDEPARFRGSHEEYRLISNWWEMDKRSLGEREIGLARDSYDRCITYLDRQIGRLFDDLERRGVLDQTLVVITADHGEHLGEQRLFGHGCSLYRPELHVPLLVVGPGLVPEGRVVRDPVSLRDLAATITDQLGLRDEAPFPGTSLAQNWGSDRGSLLAQEPRPVLSEVESPPDDDPNFGLSPASRGPMRSLVGWGYHYIRGSDGREELYNLEADPQEGRNLARSPLVTAMLQRFRASASR